MQHFGSGSKGRGFGGNTTCNSLTPSLQMAVLPANCFLIIPTAQRWNTLLESGLLRMGFILTLSQMTATPAIRCPERLAPGLSLQMQMSIFWLQWIPQITKSGKVLASDEGR